MLSFTVCFGRQYKNTIFGQADVKKVPTLFNALCKKEDFVKGVKSVWDKEVSKAVNNVNSKMIDAYAEKIEGSAVANAIRWNIYGTTDVNTIKSNFKADVDIVKDFAVKRAKFLTDNFGKVQVQNIKDPIGDTVNTILGGLNSMDFSGIVGAITGIGGAVGGLISGLIGGNESETPNTPSVNQNQSSNGTSNTPTVNDNNTSSQTTTPNVPSNNNSSSNVSTNSSQQAAAPVVEADSGGFTVWLIAVAVILAIVGILIIVL